MRMLFSLACSIAWMTALAAAGAHAADDLQYNRDIRAILSENCLTCHGPDAAARQAAISALSCADPSPGAVGGAE